MATGFSYYELPNNVAGGAAIPLSTQTVPLAAISIAVGENDLVLIRGSVGWFITDTPESQRQVSTLFKIWRGAPFTGTLVYSIRDSGESWADRNKITTFAHVDSGITNVSDVSYTLTAELPTGGGAYVTGCLTLTASDVTLY